MHGDFFEDYIPGRIDSSSLQLRDRRDMLYLGKKNLRFLADFWKNLAARRAKSAAEASSILRRDELEDEAKDAKVKARELYRMAEEAEIKPLIFEKPSFHKNSRVVVFMENPDRFVPGVIIKVQPESDDDETAIIHHATFLIRPHGFMESGTIDYSPDPITLFDYDDFEYFRLNPKYLRTYLNYYSSSIVERDKVDRMLFCVAGGRSDPLGTI